MEHFNNSNVVKNSRNPLVHSIDSAIKTARNNEEWRHDFMTWQMYGNEKYDEGKLDGEQLKAKETALRMFSKGLDVKMISEMVGETEENVKQWLSEKDI